MRKGQYVGQLGPKCGQETITSENWNMRISNVSFFCSRIDTKNGGDMGGRRGLFDFICAALPGLASPQGGGAKTVSP